MDDNGWIKVEDELPPFNKEVLVFYYPRQPVMSGQLIGIDRIINTEGMSQWLKERFDENGFRNGTTHWQYLPAKPKD